MRFESIHVQRYGHFANFDLAFGDHPFVLLFGQNEAGKTTLLEFLRQVLFGFPVRTPYNFGEGGELGGAARLSLSDRRTIDLKRRKGLKNTLQAQVAGDPQPLDEATFRRLLGNANENVFRTVFAFGLDELRRGHDALKEESLQSALFGGGLGGAFNPEALLKELESEAGNLFRPSASKPAINALAADLRRLALEVKQHSVRPDDYEQRQQAWKRAQQEADQLTEEMAQLRRKQAQVQRIREAVPLWRQRQVRLAERRTIATPSPFPIDAEHQFATATEAISRLAREIQSLQRDSASAVQQLASLELDRTLLPWRGEIEECHRLIQSVSDARRDLPVREEERQRLLAEIAGELQRLRPGWTLDDLRVFALTASSQYELEMLYRRREQWTVERTQLETRRTDTMASLEKCELDLESLGEATETGELVTVLEQVGEFTADQQAFRKGAEEQAKRQQSLELQRSRLSPPLPLASWIQTVAIQQLPAPSRELAGQFDAELRDLEQRQGTMQQSIAETETQLEQVDRELATLLRPGRSVPSLDELRQQREVRDAMWQSFRQQALEKTTGKRQAPDPEQYERAVEAADALADRIYEHADEVARREHLSRQRAELLAVLERRRDELQRLEQVRGDWELRWRELWRPCGFTPHLPHLMLNWLDSFAAFVNAHQVMAQGQIELEACGARIAAFEQRLRQLLPGCNGDARSLVASARKIAKETETRQQERERLLRERKRLKRQLQSLEEDVQRSEQEGSLWLTDWQAMLARVGLPSDWTEMLARDVLGQLAALREKLSHLSELEGRIHQMEQRIAEFDPRVRKIAERIGEPLEVEHPEGIVRVLQQRLAAATQAQERRTHLEQRRQENDQAVATRQDELDEWQAKRTRLLTSAGVETDEQFCEVAARVRRAAELDGQIQELTGQLTVARGQEPEEAFFTVLESVDEASLPAELAQLQEAIQRHQQAAEAAREKAGSLRCQFEELDGRGAAAQAQEAWAQQQARLASEVHRYVPLALARKLLQEAIQRFERENQPAMIGSISRLLSTMTRGRYVEIERPSSDQTALYVRRCDGAELSPEQLSTGTREQLYLAIRLGYVLHYCQQSEPLPIVMDDVLVNFDARRAEATLQAFKEVGQHAQILFFTCHQHVVDMVGKVYPELQPHRLPARDGEG